MIRSLLEVARPVGCGLTISRRKHGAANGWIVGNPKFEENLNYIMRTYEEFIGLREVKLAQAKVGWHLRLAIFVLVSVHTEFLIREAETMFTAFFQGFGCRNKVQTSSGITHETAAADAEYSEELARNSRGTGPNS